MYKIKTFDNYQGERNKKNLFHGLGKLLFNHNLTYEGGFKDGKRHGKGVITRKFRSYYTYDKELYDGEWAYDKIHGHGNNTDYDYEGTYIKEYEGEFRFEEKHGRGHQKYNKNHPRNEDISELEYEGEFKFGKYTSTKNGFIKYRDKSVFEGNWIIELNKKIHLYDGRMKCKTEFSNYENVYIGHLKRININTKDKPEWKFIKYGQATMEYYRRRSYDSEFEIMGKYVGDWENDKRHGHGIDIKDGNKYEGKWKNDEYHGDGIYIDKNGNRYEGKWENGGLINGETIIYANGDKYVGQFRGSSRSGFGVLTYKDGGVFTGQWKEDKKSEGVEIFSNKNKYTGQWIYHYHSYNKEREDGKFEGQGVMEYHDQNIYDGEWKGGLKHGNGVMNYPKNHEYITYKGGWYHGNFHGFGKLKFSNGNKYTGHFEYGKQEGFGVEKYAKNKKFIKYEGGWKKGLKHGHGYFDHDIP